MWGCSGIERYIITTHKKFNANKYKKNIKYNQRKQTKFSHTHARQVINQPKYFNN